MAEARQNNVLPTTLALLLHVLVLGSFVFAFDWQRSHIEPMPLAITATLVTDAPAVAPPRVEERLPPRPEPLPEPEPEVEQPDPMEEARAKAEEQLRLEELRREQQRQQEAERARLQRIEDEQERQREAEEEARRQAEEEARRKAEEEAALERQRLEAERQRQEEIERQRAENERIRREEEAARLQSEIDAEADRLAARNSNEMRAYIFAIQQKVRRSWVAPPSTPDDLECEVAVRQQSGGVVTSVRVVQCNGDAAVARSIEAAVYKASPLPAPSSSLLFDTNLRFIFKPEQ